MEERSCLGVGCGCIGAMILLTILFLLLVCGLIIWAIIGVADVQYQLDSGAQLLIVLMPLI
jgi:cytochrome b subunit of formate dehydrogenase